MNDVARTMEDPDGNFVQQFQTHGFNARVFELYLNALFGQEDHVIDRSHDRPDFLLTKDDLTIAVEAVTANAAPSREFQPYDQTPSDMPRTLEDIFRYLMHEVAIRVGSPLFSKLKKRYWDLPHVRGRPLVLAIQNFHDGGLGLSASSVSQYVYGIHHRHEFDTKGNLSVEGERLLTHEASKTIPSNFFGQSNAENISAILFCNAGTVPKFGRLGQQGSFRSNSVQMVRMGHCWDPDPNAASHDNFAYLVGDPYFPVEPWRDGAVLMHNPNALHPVPLGWMGVCAEDQLQPGGTVVPVMNEPFHVYMSSTLHLPGTMPPEEVDRIVEAQMRIMEAGQALGEDWRREWGSRR